MVEGIPIKKEVVENKKLESVGGWLLFFLIIFILGALGNLSSSVQYLTPPKAAEIYASQMNISNLIQPALYLKIIQMGISLISAALLAITSVFIFTKKKNSIKLAIISAWCGVIASIINWTILYTAIPPFSVLEDSQKLFVGLYKSSLSMQLALILIFGIAWAIIVTLYFIKSIRVKNTLVR